MEQLRRIIIEEDIFERFPGFRRGVIVARQIRNPTKNERIERILADEIETIDCKQSLDSERVTAWDEIHRDFGSNPNRFPPSIKALLKRVEKGGSPPFINSVVTLFNYISIKYLIPCGGDDVEKIAGNLRLGFAKGNELFTPLGGQETENPVAGEVIYYDDRTLEVMCRRWNWRNGEFSKITEDSERIVVNFDGAGTVPESDIKEARDEFADLLTEECAAELTAALLDHEKNEIDIDV